MHRDTQIGLAMAIVLIGFAAALCFPRDNANLQPIATLPSPTGGSVWFDAGEARVYTTEAPISAASGGQSVPAPAISRPDSSASPPVPRSQHTPVSPTPANPTAGGSVINTGTGGLGMNASSPTTLPLQPAVRREETNRPRPFPQSGDLPHSQAASSGRSNPQAEVPATRQFPGGVISPSWPEADQHIGRPVNGDDASGMISSSESFFDNGPEPVYHVVESGDTLSGLALRYLGSVTRYQELYDANRDVLDSPNSLKINTRLRIPDRTRRR